ncbi:HPP family protein [Paraburkholderia dinghuensis]|uniref:HPP family protein n=1 Tax=Paraburkholderia dinghuensis TaxID=2305225 RepID=A0A3N6MY43_9BURK|nr:HPP family protein [Paraburkholderia dinghuensis]RQH06925.1 HPP family protein [Paraburkholderia dinghuensis]
MSPSPIVAWLTNFAPHPGAPLWRERVRRCTGSTLGIAFAALATRFVFGPAGDIPMLIAPMGASAVLLFGAFESPLAQPWSILGGNCVSALIGVACARWIADPGTAASLAVALAIAAMYACRCVHPPSGAVALTAVLGGPGVHALGWRFVIEPVMFQSFALLSVAISYHALTGHRYPRAVAHAAPQSAAGSAQTGESRFEVAAAGFANAFDAMTCEDVMSTDVPAVPSTMHRKAARELLHREGVAALHVVDAMDRFVGMVTHGDLADAPASFFARLARRLRAVVKRESARVEETVEAVMKASVHAVHQATPLAGLVHVFTDHAISSVPVLDDGQRLVGVVKHSDMIRWLHRQANEVRIDARAA